MTSKLRNLFIAVDQVFNTLLGGKPDETLSARMYRNKHKKWWGKAYKVTNKIFFWQDDHCEAAYINERNRKHLPAEYQESSDV